jgi:predicted RNA-binding Zn ribbon-like protein
MTEPAVPSAIRLVRDFINTYEPQIDAESLGDTEALRNWLVEHGLIPVGATLAARDLDTAVTIREGIRNVLLGHAGHDPDPDALNALRDTLAELPVRFDLSADGYRLISTRTDPFGQGLGRLLDAIRESSQDGSWRRLKVCARDSCRWAFYDASRNQVRRWCSMAGCGNHIKMRRAYATRKHRAQEVTDPG